MPIRLKQSGVSAATHPFSFSPSPEPTPPASPSQAAPPSAWLPERDMKTFGAYPLGDIGSMELGRGVVRCGKCSRVGLESAVADHAKICDHLILGTPLTAKKAGKTRVGGDEEDSSRKRRASDFSMSPGSPSKKRSKHLPSVPPPFANGRKENKKEAKERQRLERKDMKQREKAEIAERKRMRTNGPLNLDRQCGVINDKGLPCMRSLTCKTHTVGAKRAVEGRTRSYDVLYIEWQRINNPNFKEPTGRRDKFSKDDAKRLKGGSGDDTRKRMKKAKAVGASVETLGADEDEGQEMEALIRATKYAGMKVHSTVRARLGGNTVSAFPAVIPRREVQYSQSAPADANPAGCLAIWQTGRHDQLRVGQLLASALATRKTNTIDDKRNGPVFSKGLGVQLNAVPVQS